MSLGALILFLCFFVFGYCVSVNPVHVVGVERDYVWTVFNYSVPKNALPGGKNEKGNLTFIGQTSHNDTNIILPGELDPETKTLTYAINGEHFSKTTGFRILWSNNSDYYKWIDADRDHYTEDDLVVGGIKRDRAMKFYIGRTLWNGRLIVGNVFQRTLAFAVDGKAYSKTSDYQLLWFYDPNARVFRNEL